MSIYLFFKNYIYGRGALYEHWSNIVKYYGVNTKENVGISNDNIGEKPIHRKTKVSSAMLINWGLVEF